MNGLATPLRRAFASFFLCVAVLTAHAQADSQTAITLGISWLSAQTQADGSLAGEQSSIALPIQAQAESLQTLKLLGTAPIALADRVAADSTTATEVIARRIAGLAAVGRSVSNETSLLLERQNADGGFAPFAGMASTALDTAWALIACKAGNCSATNTVSALAFLKSRQEADGGFGIYGESGVSITAVSMAALRAYGTAADAATQLAAARTFLLGKRPGSAWEDTYFNALAVLALVGGGNDATAITDAQAAIRAVQAADGSWDHDPFVTALALRALAATVPVPTAPGFIGTVLEDLTDEPVVGATVNATGSATATGVTASTGTFSVIGLASGAYTVEFSKLGFATKSMTASVSGTVPTDLGTVRLSMLSTAGIVQGRIQDGSTGAALAGATVAIQGGNSDTSDADGLYRIAGVLAGNFTVTVTRSGYQPVTSTGTITGGQLVIFSPSLYAQTPPATARVVGRVVDANGSVPLAGASVAIGSKNALTDTNGDFAVEDVAPGAISIVVAKSGYRTTTFTASVVVGTNSLGSLPIPLQQSSVTISGRISDAATTVPIAGATVSLSGVGSASTDTNGRYSLPGVTTMQFSLLVSAPGYVTATVGVTLPTLQDYTVDAALQKQATVSGLSIRSVATTRAAYDPYEAVEVEAEVQNVSTQAIEAFYQVTVRDSQGRTVVVRPAIQTVAGQDPREALIVVGANAQREIEVEWGLGNSAPGNYVAVFQAYSEFGQLLSEASTAFTVNAKRQMSGGVTADPPIAVAASGQDIKLSAQVVNHGNLDIPAGPVQLSIVLEKADTNVRRTPEAGYFPVTAKGSMGSPSFVTRDGQGRLYVADVNIVTVSGKTYYPIHRITNPDSTEPTVEARWRLVESTTPVNGVPTSMTPAGIACDGSTGLLYVVNTGSAVAIVNTADGNTTMTARSTATGLPAPAVSSQHGVDVGPDGRLYVTAQRGADVFSLLRIRPSDWFVEEIVGNGLSKPLAIAQANGNFYVANEGNNTVSQVTPQGVITTYATVTGIKGLAADGAGALYATTSTSVVKITGPNQVATYAGGTVNPGAFTSATQVASREDGTLFVLDGTAIKKVANSGGAPRVSTFARALVASPEGLRYDSSGTLYAAGSGELVALDPADQLTSLGTSLGTVRGVEVLSTGAPVVVDGSASGRLLRYNGATANPRFTALATALEQPYGVTRNGTQLYVAETSGHRISVVPEAGGAKSALVASYLFGTKDLFAVGEDVYVLNGTFISRIAGASSTQKFPLTLPAAGVAFARADDNTFVVQDNGFFRKTNTTLSSVSTISAPIVGMAPGLALGPGATVYFGVTSANALKKLVANVITDDFTGLAAAPKYVVGDGTGAAYLWLANNTLVGLTAGSPRTLTVYATNVSGVLALAFDAVSRRLYWSTTSGLFYVDTTSATNPQPPQSYASATGLSSLAVTGSGKVVALNSGKAQLATYAGAGSAPVIDQQFSSPTDVLWDGTRVLFGADQGLFEWTSANGVRLVNATAPRYLSARAGAVYATVGNRVKQLVGDALQDVYPAAGQSAPPGFAVLKGLAPRPAGGFAIGGDNGFGTSLAVITDDAWTQSAMYGGFSTVLSLAAAPSGEVFVASFGSSSIYRIPATGQRTELVATGQYRAVGVSASGKLHASISKDLYRFTDQGAPQLLATTSDNGQIDGVAFSGEEPLVVEKASALALRRADSSLVPFAAGLIAPTGLRATSGTVTHVASTNGAITRVENGVARTMVAGLGNVRAVADGYANGLFAVRADGKVSYVASDGTVADFLDLHDVVSDSSFAESITGSTDALYVALPSTTNRVDRIKVTPPPALPAPGTFIRAIDGTAPALSYANPEPATVDFGTWTPPYAGDYSLTVRPLQADVVGQAANNLHVGSAAQGLVTASVATVPPGNAAVGVNVKLMGTDFSSIAQVEPGSLKTAFPTGGPVVTVGANAQGDIFYLRSTNNTGTSIAGTKIRRVHAGVDGAFFDATTAPTPFQISMQGEIPVDADGNLYVINGTNSREIVKVGPDGLARTPYIPLPSVAPFTTDKILSIAMSRGGALFALTTTGIGKYELASGAWSRFASSPLATPFSITVDARDNVYVQYGSVVTSPQSVVRYRPDGSATALISDALMEFEGTSIAGSCSGHLFATASIWNRVNQTGGEEYTLTQVNGDTGAVDVIFNGKSISQQLTDIDVLVYDRFGSQLLIWNHNASALYRLPVSCGGLDANLRVVFAAGQDARGFNPAPVARRPLADGSVEYEWSLKAVTPLGRDVAFETVLPNMRLSEKRAVARSASIVLRNSFTNGEIVLPLKVPSVSTDAQTSASVVTDKERYGANEVVAGTIGITTSYAQSRSALLAVDVVDGNLAVIESLPLQAITLPVAGPIAAQFNTGTTLTGTYRLRATVREQSSGAVLAQAESPFDIVAPDNAIGSSVATDRVAYDPFATVYITGRARNLSLNAIATGLTLTAVVLGPAQNEVARFSRSIAQLLPGTYKDLPFAWPLQATMPGKYTVEQTLADAAGPIGDLNRTTFTVLSTADTGTGLRGSVTGPRRVNRGDPVSLKAFIENRGNASVAMSPVAVEVLNPGTSTSLKRFEFDAQLAVGESLNRDDFVWTTDAAPAGSYTAVLSARVAGNLVILGQDSILVGDLDQLSFQSQTGVDLGVPVMSNPVTIGGLATSASISVGANAQYRIGQGEWRSDVSTVSNGDVVQVRVTSSTAYNTTTTAQLTIGTRLLTFSVTTKSPPPDGTPDAFTFPSQLGVAPSSVRTSAEVTVTGINMTVPISITGGSYSVNGGPFVTADGTVVQGDRVRVQLVAAAGFATTTSTQVAIGGVAGTFSATTLDVSGMASAFPTSPTAGQTVSLTGSVQNLGAEALSGATATITVTNAATSQVVETQAYPVTVPAQQSATFGGNWTVQGQPGDRFSVKAELRLGTAIKLLGTTEVVVGASPVNVAIVSGLERPQRLLVLVSCVAGGTGTTCLDQRRQAVDTLLTARGIDHKVVTDDLVFQKEMRTGSWTAYWISGGSEKLGSTVFEELQSAVSRGDALLVDAMHDNRNNGLDALAGVKYRGERSQDSPPVLFLGGLYPAGTLTAPGRGWHVDLQGGAEQARFPETGSGSGTISASPAIVSGVHGLGRTVFVALDLVRALTEQPAAWNPVLDVTLGYLEPQASTTVAAGSLTQVAIALDNNGPAVDLVLTAKLPAGVTFEAANGQGAWSETTRTVTWSLHLDPDASAERIVRFRAQTTAGANAVEVKLYSLTNGQQSLYREQSVAFTVASFAAQAGGAITMLNGLNLTTDADKAARTTAVARLQEAQALAAAADYAGAITKLIAASGAVDDILGADVTPILNAIDLALQDASWRWSLTQSP